MGLFDGLEQLGFSELDKVDILEKNEKRAPKEEKKKPEEEPDFYLVSKTVTCPVCGLDFIDYVTRKSKLRVESTDTDMRTIYHVIDANRYDVTLCVHCGYAAMNNIFDRINDKQANEVIEKVMPNYRGRTYSVPLTSEDAAERYKLALLCAVARGAKSGEKGLLCLKTAWIYRGADDKKNEILFIQTALKLFKDAFSSEPFPIGALDENAMQLLIAELSRRVGDFEEAKKWLGPVIVNRSLNSAIRNRAETIKELITAKKII